MVNGSPFLSSFLSFFLSFFVDLMKMRLSHRKSIISIDGIITLNNTMCKWIFMDFNEKSKDLQRYCMRFRLFDFSKCKMNHFNKFLLWFDSQLWMVRGKKTRFWYALLLFNDKCLPIFFYSLFCINLPAATANEQQLHHEFVTHVQKIA